MRSFDLINDYDTHGEGVVNTSPFWVIAVVRLANQLSYSRANKASIDNDSSRHASTIGDPLVISSDCIQLSIHGDKGSHVKSLNATLIQSNINYLATVLPGDWVLAWIVSDEADGRALLDKISRLDPCNGFRDGLKFVGRVKSMRKHFSIDHNSGWKNSRYQLAATAFNELDTQFFYDPNLASIDVSQNVIGSWLARLGTDVQSLFNITQQGIDDNVHLIIPTYIQLLVGKGVPATMSNNTGNQQLQAGTGSEAPFAYMVPQAVGRLLGKTAEDISKQGGVLSYADVLELLYGVQDYSQAAGGQSIAQQQTGDATDVNAAYTPDVHTAAGDHTFLTPRIDRYTSKQHKYTGTPMMGSFWPVLVEFTNKPLWSLLQNFLNPTVNEMFTCLRSNENGKIVPTIVLRQIPFTTEAFATDQINFTRFLDLPRWRISGGLVLDYDIGRSDSTRCNFVHVYGTSADLSVGGASITEQLVNNPPIRDDLDIQRSGLHPYMTTVSCHVANTIGTVPGRWMECIADFMMGSHLTLNGTLQIVGCHLPICEGDNVEFDGAVFHIESVAHQCSIDTYSGKRTFTTTLSLTNGMRASGFQQDAISMYPGLLERDHRQYDPGLSQDTDFPVTLARPDATPRNEDSQSVSDSPTQIGTNQTTTSDERPMFGPANDGTSVLDGDQWGSEIQVSDAYTWRQ